MQLGALKAVGCAKIFRDHGVSGARASRPGLDKALRVIRPNDVLVVYKLDRLGRSVFHLTDLLKRFHAEGIHFCSLTEGINTTTPHGRFIYHLLSGIAELQRDLIRENTVHGLRAARDQGKQIGRPHSLDSGEILNAHTLVHRHGIPIKRVASDFGVCHATLMRAFKRLGLET
ncbi:recombinase family protein [bacterium]|nr:recombinase family protein [bacterium]